MPLIEPEFIQRTHGLDVDAFWAENALCYDFTPRKPRCPLSFSPDDHWLFTFLGAPSTLRYYQEKDLRDAMHAEANRSLRAYVGRAYFDEDTFVTSPKRIENLFGCEFAYYEGSTPWLTPVVPDESEASARAFSRILDSAEATDVSAWGLPDDFRAEWDERARQGRSLPALGRGSRGPATIMTSVLKPETLFYWCADRPELIRRFSSLLAEKMVDFNRALRAFSGSPDPGWWITDDNCALFNRRLYREYCFPVLARVLDELAPLPAGGAPETPVQRYQHSDSAMAHLLDMQRELGINAVNYGPTVDAGLIREKLPGAWICGQMPPMLLREGSPEAIREQVRYDFARAGAGGGLEITTAGSLPAGVGLGRMRWLMQVVQEETRYPSS